MVRGGGIFVIRGVGHKLREKYRTYLLSRVLLWYYHWIYKNAVHEMTYLCREIHKAKEERS